MSDQLERPVTPDQVLKTGTTVNERSSAMNDKIFLACFDKGVARAECGPNGDWTVQQLATEHKIHCLAADPSERRRVYAGTPHGVLRSEDCGLTWQPNGMDGHIVKSLAVLREPFFHLQADESSVLAVSVGRVTISLILELLVTAVVPDGLADLRDHPLID